MKKNEERLRIYYYELVHEAKDKNNDIMLIENELLMGFEKTPMQLISKAKQQLDQTLKENTKIIKDYEKRKKVNVSSEIVLALYELDLKEEIAVDLLNNNKYAINVFKECLDDFKSNDIQVISVTTETYVYEKGEYKNEI